MSKTSRSMPKYEQLATTLRADLLAGRWQSGEQLPAERQLAEEYGMSHMTVNKAVASLVAKGMLRRRGRATYIAPPEDDRFSRGVGAVFDLDPMRSPQLLRPLLTALSRERRLPLLIDILDPRRVGQQLRELCLEGVTTFLVDAFSYFPFEMLGELSPYPRMIFLHRYESHQRYPGTRILLDYREVGRMAARCVLEAGRLRPAIIGFERQPLWTSQLFYEGAMEVLDAAGVALHAEWLTVQLEDDSCVRFLRQRPRVDSIITVNDFRLVPFVQAAAKTGVRIPEDLVLVGAGNTSHAEAWDLTSICLQPETMVERAMDALDSGMEVDELLPPILIARASCPWTNHKKERSDHNEST